MGLLGKVEKCFLEQFFERFSVGEKNELKKATYRLGGEKPIDGLSCNIDLDSLLRRRAQNLDPESGFRAHLHPSRNQGARNYV